MKYRLSMAGLCLLAACESLPKGVAPTLSADTPVMTTAEINSTLVGKNIAGSIIGSGRAHGTTWTQTTLPDGSLQFAGSDGSRDTGHRTVRDNASCETWASFGPGVEKCYKVARQPGDQFVSYRPDGEVGSLFKIVP